MNMNKKSVECGGKVGETIGMKKGKVVHGV
jgi:hypothetical protein